MNTHRLLVDYHDFPNYGDIAREAAALARNGLSEIDILRTIIARFGPAPEKLTMRSQAVPVKFWGVSGVDFDAKVENQIYTAARLPVARQAAVMPDAHVGYALPIGGVIALENAVSPYFVGFDIACRMHITILDLDPGDFLSNRSQFIDDLDAVTHFGVGVTSDRLDHPVLSDDTWKTIATAKNRYDLAAKQIGTSGAGNHFADLMIGNVVLERDWLPLKINQSFVALVTHSGSRGFGHKMATHYSQLAKEQTAKKARGIHRDYAWLDLDTDAGREYWAVMQLAGKYAQANHQIIHDRFLGKAGLSALAQYENHHNFAWRHGDFIIHRKGATPAHKGQIGIIPGSMATQSFLVEGLGNPDALYSSSHGAGRVSSRTEAKKNVNWDAYREHVQCMDVIARGVAADETYQAYKDIQRVIDLQRDLIEIIAVMEPKVVIMGEKKRRD